MRTAACHALGRLLPHAPADALAAAAPAALTRAAALTCASAGEALSYPVDAIIRAVMHAPAAGAAAVPSLLPSLLLLWVVYARDPHTAPSLSAAIEALAMLQPEEDRAAAAVAQGSIVSLVLPMLAAACAAAVDPAADVLVPLLTGGAGGGGLVPLSAACASAGVAFGALLPAHREAVSALLSAPPGTIAQALAPVAVEIAITALRAIGPPPPSPPASGRGASAVSPRPLQRELAGLVSVVVRTALANPDHKFRGHACTLAAVALRRYGSAGAAGGLLPSVSLDASPAPPGSLSLGDALRLVAATLASGDAASAVAAPLAAAIARTAFEGGGHAVFAPVLDALLPLLSGRLALDTEPAPSVVGRMVMVIAYLIIAAPGPVSVALVRTTLRVDARAKLAPPLSAAGRDVLMAAVAAGQDVTVPQTAAAIFLRAWCTYHGVLALSRIVERTTALAVLRLLEHQAGDPSLLLAVQAEVVAAPAESRLAAGGSGITTRSKAKSQALPDVPPVSLPARAFSLLVTDWLDAMDDAEAEARGGACDDDDDNDDGDDTEDDEDGGDDESDDDARDVDAGDAAAAEEQPTKTRKSRGGRRRAFMDADEAAALYGHFDEDGEGCVGKGISARDVVDLNDLLAGGWADHFGADNGDGDDDEEDVEEGARREIAEDLEVWSELQDEEASPGGAVSGSIADTVARAPVPLDPLLALVSSTEGSLASAGAASFKGMFARVQSGSDGPLVQVLRTVAQGLSQDSQKRLFARIKG